MKTPERRSDYDQELQQTLEIYSRLEEIISTVHQTPHLAEAELVGFIVHQDRHHLIFKHPRLHLIFSIPHPLAEGGFWEQTSVWHTYLADGQIPEPNPPEEPSRANNWRGRSSIPQQFPPEILFTLNSNLEPVPVQVSPGDSMFAFWAGVDQAPQGDNYHMYRLNPNTPPPDDFLSHEWAVILSGLNSPDRENHASLMEIISRAGLHQNTGRTLDSLEHFFNHSDDT